MDALHDVIYLVAIAVEAVVGNNARGFSLLDDVHRFGAAGEVEVKRGAFAVKCVAHTKTFGKQPTAFGINDRAVRIIVLSHDVVYRAADADDAGREDAGGPAKEKLNEISIMDMQIEQSASEIVAAGVSALSAPT